MEQDEVKKLKARIRQARQDLERMPHDLSLMETLGRLYMLTGQDNLGLKHLSTVAKARARVGDYLDAIRLCNEIIAADPGRREVALYLASLYAQAPELAHRSGLSATVATSPEPRGVGEPVDAASLVAVHSPEDLSIDEVPEGVTTLDLEPVDDLEPAEAPPARGAIAWAAPHPPRTQALMEQIRSDDNLQAISLELDDDEDFSDVSRAIFPDELEGAHGELLGAQEVDTAGLPDIPLLSSLPHRAFAELMGAAAVRTADPGEILVREGEIGEAIYIVISGKVRVHTGAGARLVVLAELGPGAFFGEIAMLSGQVRRATVTAAAPTEVFVIAKDVLDNLRLRYPMVDGTLTRFYETRLVARFLAVSPLFHSLPVEEREALANRFHAMRLARGERLFSAGERPDGLYLICEGRISIEIQDRPLAVLGEGDLLGVVAALKRRPLGADAVASTDCMVQILDDDNVEQILIRRPDVHQVLTEMASRREKVLG